MPERKQPSTSVCEESIDELDAQAKQFSERIQHLLAGDKPPEVTQRAIAVTIDGTRARAYINRVSCASDDRIICWATAIPEGSSDTRHWIDLTFRRGQWSITIKHSYAFVDGEDVGELVY